MRMFRCMCSRRRSSQRYFMRSASSTFSSSSWNGSGGAVESTVSSSTWTSTSPVGIFGFTVSGERRTIAPRACEDELVADAVRDARRVGSVLGVHDELRHAGLVAKVDEDEAAVVAAPRRPAGERDGPALVLGPRLAAAEVSPAHAPRLAASSSRVVGSSPPGRTIRAPSASTTTVVFAPSRAACVSCPFFERPA